MQFLATQCYSVQCFLHSLRLPRTTYSQQKRNSKKPKKQFSEGLGGGTLLSQESDLFVFCFSRGFLVLGLRGCFPELSTLVFFSAKLALSKVIV